MQDHENSSAIGMWRARLEFLGLTVAGATALTAIGYHALALGTEGEAYTTSLRSASLLANVALFGSLLLAILVVLLPRLMFQWPRTTPNRLAISAFVTSATAAILTGIIGAVGFVGALSEIGIDQIDRESELTGAGLWGALAIGLAVTVLSVVAIVYSVTAILLLREARDVSIVEPEGSAMLLDPEFANQVPAHG